MVTIFNNIKETSTPFYKEIDVIYERIRSGKCKEIIEAIRKEKDKAERNLIKKKLPAICFSGTFNRRADDAIIEHSGYICLDFDGFKTSKEMMDLKKKLSEDDYTNSVFISPSGDGLKVVVKIPKEISNHKGYFVALEKHYNNDHFDKSCKNISRVCYESYDPSIYINEFSETWTKTADDEHEHINKIDRLDLIFISDKYEIVRRLKIWWHNKFGMVEGTKNNNLFILASALNEFGVDKSTAEYVLLEYDEGGKRDEILAILRSAYKNTAIFSTKAFEDTATTDKIRKSVKSGVAKKDLVKQLVDRDVDEEEAEKIVETISNDASIKEFWTINEKGRVSIVPHLFKEFLEDNGFFKYYPNESQNFVFIRVMNNLIYTCNDSNIKDFVLDYLINLDNIAIYNYFALQLKFFKEDFLSIISSIDIHFVEDTKDESYLYFRNCAVKVTKNRVEKIDYIDLGGYVYSDQIINRDFNISKVKDCDFSKFISNISGGETMRVNSVESTIGYLIHSYKDDKYSPAVILNDEVISDNPEGGTGKGLFVNAISKIRKTVTIEGKSFSFEKNFPYQTVQNDTQILSFDDVIKNFDFERLFSVVTEGITLEKKNKDAIKLSFKESPKIIITTNYPLKGSGNSHERRRWEIEFKQYYNMRFTPFNEFKRSLFTEWDAAEWSRFDNYMISNLQKYLTSGFITSEFKNLEVRRFIAETDHSFYEFMTDKDNEFRLVNTKHYKQDIYMKFITDYPDYAPNSRYRISLIKFYKWIDSYSSFMTGDKPLNGKDAKGRWVIYNKQDDKNELEF